MLVVSITSQKILAIYFKPYIYIFIIMCSWITLIAFRIWIGILFLSFFFFLISFPCIHVSMVYNSRSFNVDVCFPYFYVDLIYFCMLVISVFDVVSQSFIIYQFYLKIML